MTEMQAFGTSERVGHKSDQFYGRRMFDDGNGDSNNKLRGVPVTKNINQNHQGLVKSESRFCNKIFCHSSENMAELPDDSVHLMVTSPPYNVGKDYDEDLSFVEYRELLSRVFAETYRVLVPGGRACVNVANLGRKPYIPLNSLVYSVMDKIGFLMRGEIIWNKSASAGSSCAWGSWCSPSNPVLRDIHEYILVFCKTDYSRKRKDGVATIARDDFLNSTKSVWEFPAESAKRVKHPAPFPVELPKRLIELYTYANEIVLDPFMGSGTTAIAAQNINRNWVGFETSQGYVKIANERLNKS